MTISNVESKLKMAVKVFAGLIVAMYTMMIIVLLTIRQTQVTNSAAARIQRDRQEAIGIDTDSTAHQILNIIKK